ncbi:MAG: ThuA domain-containing protein [Gemmataceae bacterium]|nr:ThuA domain-containing protein [Gemmataceae bacterium]
MRSMLAAALLAVTLVSSLSAQEPQWVVYEGGEGPGKGKHVVLISGDEEYRSEETMPQFGKILAKHHGFKCTVLFAIDKDGAINPNVSNIPGLEALKSADLMIIFTRFRNLPDDQMQHIVDYVESGKPVIGMRTATHAFNIPNGRKFAKYGNGFGGKDYAGGFGKQVLGERWVNHHGGHGKESTRGIIAKEAADHPIVRGIKDGDIWGTTDVYTVTLPLPNSTPIVYGQVLKGMKFDDAPVEGKKNNPMMPVSWTRNYKGESGKEARVFNTTMGASEDFTAEGTRRMMVNGTYWALGLEDQIAAKSNVEIVGEFKANPFGNNGFKKGAKPSDHAMSAR